MTTIQLYRPDEEYLSSNDAIRRIAPAYRHVVLDRARGEAEYLKEWDKVKSLNAPEVILQTYSLANCRTVWVEVTDDDGADGWVRFALWSRRDIFIDFSSEEGFARLRPTVEKLAMLLGYVVECEATEASRLEAGNSVGDVVFRFQFSFLPYANPPGLQERFEKSLRQYFDFRGFYYGLVALEGKTSTRGFVRGKDRSLTEEDSENLAAWAMAQRIKCSALLGSLEYEVDELGLFEEIGGWIFLVDNLTDEDRAEAADCQAMADHFVRSLQGVTAEQAASDDRSHQSGS